MHNQHAGHLKTVRMGCKLLANVMLADDVCYLISICLCNQR